MAGPKVIIDLDRIARNAAVVCAKARAAGISVFGVTKGTCGMPQVARAMLRGGVAGIAESRFENIDRLRRSGIACPIMLLRSPPPMRLEALVRHVDISLQSEMSVLREISRVAVRLERVHDVILMIDLGDLREGIWPNDLVATAEQVADLRGVRIAGVGTNLTCFGAIVPDTGNMARLVACAYQVESIARHPLDWVSGGNSSSLPLLLSGNMPAGINQLRIGEAILQGGRDTFRDAPWDALDRDAFLLTGQLIEVKIKPSIPIGTSGVDAFGRRPAFVDEGDRVRGIANIGREDVHVEGLIPTNPGVRVLGASSDHLVLDLTEAVPPLQVGEAVGFRMDYGALLATMTSEYVGKMPVQAREEIEPVKRLTVCADAEAAEVVARQPLHERLSALGFMVMRVGYDHDAAEPPGLAHGEAALWLGADRQIHYAALQAMAGTFESFGVIWIDPYGGLMPDRNPELAPVGARSVLARALRLLPPQLSPENVALVGLRDTEPAEAADLRASRLGVYPMDEIDAIGIRETVRRAVAVAASGTRAVLACYSPTATEIPGWAFGSGGLTIRETHQMMEALSHHGIVRSLSVADLSFDQEQRIHNETVHFILSAFGKRIW